MISCRQATQLVSQGQDRSLGLGERVALRVHVAICSGCRNAERQLAFLRRAMARLADDDGAAQPGQST